MSNLTDMLGVETRDEPGNSNTLPLIRFQMFERDGIAHGITTRTPALPEFGNVSFAMGGEPEAIRQNRERWSGAIGIDWTRLVLGRQVHETTVALVSDEHAGCGADSFDSAIQRVDGLITSQPGVPVGVMAADCVPLLIHDPVAGAVGAIHAGWRGTVEAIAVKAVESFVTQFGSDPANLAVGIGPCICPGCYEVGHEVIERWLRGPHADAEDVVRRFPDGSNSFDLRTANRVQLKAAGVPEANIELSDVCTRCASGLTFSRRGLGPKTGLFMSIIMLR